MRNIHFTVKISVTEHLKILNMACQCLWGHEVFVLIFIPLWIQFFLWDDFYTENEFCCIKVLSCPMKTLPSPRSPNNLVFTKSEGYEFLELVSRCYDVLERESRFTLGTKVAKNTDYSKKKKKKCFKQKLFRIKFPTKNSVDTCLYLPQEWS